MPNGGVHRLEERFCMLGGGGVDLSPYAFIDDSSIWGVIQS